ncbi:MAG: hypothetical protein QOD69_2574 [Solirubrobacteraceae bacterium]|nr:hypothetical protein [Solirubrobacteraceae bacterium]
MRLLFVFQDPGRVRYFERPLSLMATRGHDLHVLVESSRERIPEQLSFIRELAARHENVTLHEAAKRKSDRAGAARALRTSLDYLHYLQPAFDASPDFRARARDAAPGAVARLARVRPLRRALRRVLDATERALPIRPDVLAVLDDLQPDVVLVTPYVWFAAPQTDWVRAAKRRGIHSVACMFSWDNLTSKGSLREVPELMTVWNAAQREEAHALHGVPRDRIVLTGAQNWDHWFDWEPTTDRAAFCAEVGLDPSRPFVVWLESSGYVGGEERFLDEWLTHLRARGGERTRDAGVLVRPHPQISAERWGTAELERFGNVAVWPRDGEVPLDGPSRSRFFDTLYHCAAVVGVNTSAFIESAIVGRPCLTLTLAAERFPHGTVNTVHFRHLLDRNGGPLIVASSFQEHLDQLEAAVADPARAAEQGNRFVEQFVRPHGRDVAAAPRVVEAVEALAAAPAPAPQPNPPVVAHALAAIALRLTVARP